MATIAIIGSGMIVFGQHARRRRLPASHDIDEILTEKKPVDIPWEKFTFER